MARLINAKTRNEILSYVKHTYGWRSDALDEVFKKITKRDADTLQTLFNDAFRQGQRDYKDYIDEQINVASKYPFEGV